MVHEAETDEEPNMELVVLSVMFLMICLCKIVGLGYSMVSHAAVV